MLTRFFRQDHPTGFLLLPLLVLLLWPGAGAGGMEFFATGTGATGQVVRGMPLYLPVRWLMALSPWVALLLGITFQLGLAYSLNRMANDAGLFERRNHLAVLLLPLLLALQPFGLVPGPAFLGVWAVTMALERVWKSVGRQRMLTAVFDAGLLLGLAGCFYLPCTFLIVVLWATLAVTRPFKWREYVLPAVGMATILVLCWGVVHFIDPALWQPVASMHFAPGLEAMATQHWMYGVVLITMLATLATASMLSFAAVYTHSVMQGRNIRASFLAFAFAMGLLAVFAWLLNGRIPAVLLAAPAAVFLTYPLLPVRRSYWDEAAVWGLLLLACWARWAG